MAISRNKLSESVDGTAISAGYATTLIHTAVTGTTNLDEIWIYVIPQWGTEYIGEPTIFLLTWGGETSPDDEIWVNLPILLTPSLIIPGLILNNGKTVNITVADPNAPLWVMGHVNEIRP
jgi:hypothetical protein